MDRRAAAAIWGCACGGVLLVHLPGNAHPVRTLAPTVVVIHGHQAPAFEVRLARRMAERSRLHGGWGYNLLSDREAAVDPELLARSDLVVVGRPSTNDLVRQHWSHWAWQEGMPGARPPYYLPADCDFFVFGVGGFKQESLGYIYTDRNPYNRYAETEARRQDASPPPYRLMVVITGSDSLGMRRGANEFLRTGLLNGVVASDRTRETHAPFEAPPSLLPTAPPAWMEPADDGPLPWSGWHQPNALDYAGFTEIAGTVPLMLWRLQYASTSNPATDSPRWHRQASDAEVLVAELPDPQTATRAAHSLRAALGDGWSTLNGWRGEAWRKQIAGAPFHVCRIRTYVLMETLQPPQDARILHGIVDSIYRARGSRGPSRRGRIGGAGGG